ncbi:hypothetical protein N7535_002736 [Penicillium sp. DV-2018c]|nr:hypothetical protein N7461_001578 [Penicillium sp. DV-2018c]KAJ5575810.1 hypothetical protein N7535_002736 [Penicillium sp. DV-2018c]
MKSVEWVLETLNNLRKMRIGRRILRSDPSSPLALSIASQRVIAIVRLERPGEAESFAEWEEEHHRKTGDRRLLWHGSPNDNFIGILRDGLRIYEWATGIYFAEMSSKSAGYCESSGEALLLLCEVELGKLSSLSVENRGRSYYETWRDAGGIHPDLQGSKVPDFDSRSNTEEGRLYHSEFIVSNPKQIRHRYLFHVELGNKCKL